MSGVGALVWVTFARTQQQQQYELGSRNRPIILSFVKHTTIWDGRHFPIEKKQMRPKPIYAHSTAFRIVSECGVVDVSVSCDQTSHTEAHCVFIAGDILR